MEIINAVTGGVSEAIKPVLDREEIIAMQDMIRRVPAAKHLVTYAAKLVRATRPAEADAPDFIKDWVSWGCGPRAGLNLVSAAKARAVLDGRFNVALEDIRALALPVFRHRLGLNFSAMSDGISTDEVIRKLLETVPADASS